MMVGLESLIAGVSVASDCQDVNITVSDPRHLIMEKSVKDAHIEQTLSWETFLITPPTPGVVRLNCNFPLNTFHINDLGRKKN